MGTKDSLYKVDPLNLQLGMMVGPWRITGRGGRGGYGTLYRVEHKSRRVGGPFALKLAISPRDERFKREAHLLRRIHCAYVPGVQDQGVWEHPSGAYPYLVMEWIDGEPLYTWASHRNPSSRQSLVLLAQLARALEATHAMGGVHRDVKGGNVLVRFADGQAFLTDFGAGNFRGADTLTSTLLPPGTPPYRSPEAWAFQRVFSQHPTAHYAASACDDLFALGVMAYRLVTDEYPPSIRPQHPEEEVRGEGKPRPPCELNPEVSPELNASILSLLAVAPIERFSGVAQKAAEVLEQRARSADPRADQPLFCVGLEYLPRWRDPDIVRFAAAHDAAARYELEQSGPSRRDQGALLRRWPQPSASTVGWAMAGASALLGVGLTLRTGLWTHQGQVPRAAPSSELQNVAVGDGVKSVTPESVSPSVASSAVGRAWPEKLLPGQRRPPCTPRTETMIKDACWTAVRDMSPPCGPNAFEREDKCYIPAPDPTRQPTSVSPE
jgi:serine/threonine protein kinase